MTKRLTIDFIKEELKKRNCLLLEDKYINARTKLKYKCLQHPKETKERTWDVFKRTKYSCDECEGESISARLTYSFERVNEEFNKRDYILLETTYINANSPLRFQCKKHSNQVQTIKLAKLSQGAMCKICAKEAPTNATRHDKDFVFGEYKKKGLIVLDSEYKNTHTPIRFYCVKHPEEIQSNYYDNIRSNGGCRYCGIERRSGVNSPNYNKNLTEEDRIRKRTYKEYTYWRNDVFKRDKYTCKCCGQYGGTLNAHHKNSYDTYIDQRLELANGVTLCLECHKEFHSNYGRGNNNESQFKEFLIYKNTLRYDDEAI